MGVPHNPVGLWLVLAGLVVSLVGFVIWFGGLGWFGHLPGDIRIERETVKVYIPFGSMLLLSLLLSLVVYAVRKFF